MKRFGKILSVFVLGSYMLTGCESKEIKEEPKYNGCAEFSKIERKAIENGVNERAIVMAREYDIVARGLYDRLHGTNRLREGTLEKWHELYLHKSFALTSYNSKNRNSAISDLAVHTQEHVAGLGIETNKDIIALGERKEGFQATTNR